VVHHPGPNPNPNTNTLALTPTLILTETPNPNPNPNTPLVHFREALNAHINETPFLIYFGNVPPFLSIAE
jgi:hypothetical protein